MENKKFLFFFVLILIFLLIFFINVEGASATICNNSLISNSSNEILSTLVGNNSMPYYFYEGYKMNKIFYPKILNLTGVTKSSYFVIVSYKFSYVFNTTATLKFILPEENKCDKLIFYGGHNLVKSYNLSKIISPKEAISVAEQLHFNMSNPRLALIPSEVYKNKSSFLVPGYSSIQDSKIIYINALNSESHIQGLMRPLNSPTKINSSDSQKQKEAKSPISSKEASSIPLKKTTSKYFLLLFLLIPIGVYIIRRIKNEKK